MALTRKFLSALGIEADKVDEIISAHSETVEALKNKISSLEADAEEHEETKKKVKELQKIVDESKDDDKYKVKYDAIKEEFDNYKKGITEKEALKTKEDAYRKLLKEAGVSEKRIDSVMKVSDLSSVELDDNGNIKDSGKHTEAIKADWSDFIVQTRTDGVKTPTPPKNEGGNSMTKEEIAKIKDPAERRQRIAENASLFGIE